MRVPHRYTLPHTSNFAVNKYRIYPARRDLDCTHVVRWLDVILERAVFRRLIRKNSKTRLFRASTTKQILAMSDGNIEDAVYWLQETLLPTYSRVYLNSLLSEKTESEQKRSRSNACRMVVFGLSCYTTMWMSTIWPPKSIDFSALQD